MKRLPLIISLVPAAAGVIADVGTDHGIVLRELRRILPAARLIAADINPNPLLQARLNFDKWGIGDIALIVSDGFASLPRDIDTVIIAGMGGETIADILENALNYGYTDVFAVLQPMTKHERMLARIAPLCGGITEHTAVEGRRTYRVYTAVFNARAG